MKGFINRIYYNPRYSKAFHWGKLITITGTGQFLSQLIGLVSGILIIRLLPTKEYALYTLVNTMLGTITLLGDGGIISGVVAEGGKVWQNREQLGAVVNTGLKLRKKFALITLIFAVPALTYLLIHHGASWLMTLLIILSLIPAFYAALSDSLLEIAPKLKQDILPLQKNVLAANVGRLVLITTTAFFLPYAFIAVFAGGLPRIWANIQLRKISSGYVDFKQHTSKEVEKKIINFVKRILPGVVYYCLSGQIITWLVSILGTTTAIAQVGALGRLSMLLGFFSVLFNTLVSPRYARLTNKSELLNRYTQIHIALLLFGVCIMILVWMFSSQVLWILGKEYLHLHTELFLNMVGTVIGMISGLSYSLQTCRGWALNPIISIPIQILSIIIGILLFDISSLKGILIFNIFLVVIQTFINFIYGYIKVIKENRV